MPPSLKLVDPVSTACGWLPRVSTMTLLCASLSPTALRGSQIFPRPNFLIAASFCVFWPSFRAW